MSNPNSLLNQSNPENIVTAPKGSIFSRNADNFFLFTNGTVKKLNVSKKAFALLYKNNIWYPTLKEDTISFATDGETWLKIGSGTNKTGWKQLSSTKSIFATEIDGSIAILGNIIGAWAGYNSSYILNSSNELWATGENGNGQLGIGNTDYRGSASLVLTDVKLAASSCEGYFAGAVKNDNTLWFTGEGGAESFGNGAASDYDTWTQTVLEGTITGSGAITNLVTGEYYSALLMEDDTLWVSTDETFGLGASTFTQITSSIKSISGGGYHLLFVKNDNTLWGIGNNNDYQLGTEVSSSFDWDNPYQITSSVASCAAMGYHSAYIDTSGNLFTFGNNGNGQLGTSYGYDDFDVSEPQLIDTDVKFVGGGDNFTYYIKNNDTLYGMGYNGDGQLSDKFYNDVIEPTVIDTDVTYAVGGNQHGLYIKSDKTLYGMGYNYQWQLGKYALPFSMYYTDATGWTIEGTDEFIFTDSYGTDEIYWRDVIYADGKFIAGGGEGNTQIKYSANGKNWSSGSITNVEGGITGIAYNGTNTYVAVSSVSNGYNDGRPEAFTSSDGITWTTGSLNNTNYDELNRVRYVNNKFIAVGDNRIVTSSNGTDWAEQTGSFDAYNTSVAYGNGKYVISTNGGTYNSYEDRSTFTQTFDGNTASYISAGEDHVLVLKDDTLYGMGYNGDGQLGKDSSLNTFIKFVPIVSNVRNVASGRDHVTFVKNDNTLWGMGDNYEGQLGDGTRVERYSPVQIDTNVSQSFCSSENGTCTAYIKNDNTLWGMGYNSDGQLTGSVIGTYVTASIQLDTNVVQAAISDNHILYIKSNGNLYGIGYNNYGQLGTGDTETYTSSYLIDTNVVSCAVSDSTSYYIKNDNTLYGMGYNGYGQLGTGNTTDQTTPFMIATGSAQVSAENNFALFVALDGTLYGMGYNGYGQLGTGDYTSYDVPTISTTNVSKVSCGEDFTYIIKNDGTVLATGDNNYNVLGITNTADKVMYSTDATTWHTASVPDYYYNDIAFGNNKFVMVSGDESFVVSSTDAINWTSSYITTSSYVSLSKVIYDGTKFVASSYYTNDGYNIFTSTDAVNWTASTTGYNSRWGALAYGDAKYVLLSGGWQNDVNPKVKLNIG
jgi:alpha-tubulin suppressor-like RCC1 family protein